MIKITINNSFCHISGDIPTKVLTLISECLSYSNDIEYELKSAYFLLKRMRGWGKSQQELDRQRKKIEDLKASEHVYLFVNQKFPTGLLGIVKKCLTKSKCGFVVDDLRVRPDPHLILPWKNKPFKPRYYQKEMIDIAVKEGRTVLESCVGCHSVGAGILMFDGTIKKVEEVVVGDNLMGPDSTPRRVLKLCRGRGKMYQIIPVKGAPFTVNEDHVLSLKYLDQTKPFRDRVRDQVEGGFFTLNMTVKDYLDKPESRQPLYKLYRTGVEFPLRDPPPIDPYILGLWLGDGHSVNLTLTTMDHELSEAWIQYFTSFPGTQVCEKFQKNNKSSLYIVKGLRTYQSSPARIPFKELNLFSNKHIPKEFLTSSRNNRLQLLAGILDADGHLNCNTFEITQKVEKLSNQIVYLARSLGFSAYIKRVQKRCVNTDTWGIYFRTHICGHTNLIPTKLPRKMARPRRQKKNVLHTGFTVEDVGEGDFYGFQLDSDHLYLMDDFTVCHNSGKTLVSAYIIKKLRVNTLFVVPSSGLGEQTLREFKLWFGTPKVASITTQRVRAKKELPPIRIITIQSLASLKKTGDLEHLIKDVDCLFLDEAHHAASKTHTDLLPYLNHVYFRFSLTGTFCRNDSKILSLWGVLSHVGYRYPAKKAIADGFLTPMRVVGHKIQGLSSQKYPTEYDKNYAGGSALLAEVGSIIESVDLSKEQVLVLVKLKTKSGELLTEFLKLQGYNPTFISGDNRKEEINDCIRRFNEGKIRILIGSSVIGEGIDIRATHHLINCQGGKSAINVVQGAGRLVRLFPGKLVGTYHDFDFVGTKFLSRHFKARLKILKENFDPEEVVEI